MLETRTRYFIGAFMAGRQGFGVLGSPDPNSLPIKTGSSILISTVGTLN